MSDEFWQQIDELYISVYPGKEIKPEDLKNLQPKLDYIMFLFSISSTTIFVNLTRN